MSKRYGRQQKRKARALIEKLQSQVAQNSKDTVVARRIIEVAYDICPNSICFEPAIISRNSYQLYQNTLDVPWGIGVVLNDVVVDTTRIDLYQLEIDLRESDFGRAVHFEASLLSESGRGYVSAYRISKEGIKSINKEYIASRLAEHLVCQGL